MRPGAPALETEIQWLIARYPDLVGGEGELLSICQEASISDNEGGSGRWSLDNLFVTQLGIPVLVECKRAADPRIRREVIAQMFEYAANCTNWRTGEIPRLFADTCRMEGRDPEDALRDFLGSDTTIDDFWSRVDANLKSGKIRLLFVADSIPRELAKIVEFLNEQMIAEVLAIELNWFVDTGGSRSIVPRVIGATQRADAQRKPFNGPKLITLDQGEWIEKFVEPHGDQAVQLAKSFFMLAHLLDGEIEYKNDWASISVKSSTGKRLNVLGLYPKGKFAINLATVQRARGPNDVELEEAVASLTAITGPLSGKSNPSFSSEAMLDDVSRPRLVEALRRYVHLCQSAAPPK
jgi:hypothetical protein